MERRILICMEGPGLVDGQRYQCVRQSVNILPRKADSGTTNGMGAESIDMRVEPMTVQRQAVEKLRAAILSGEYAPGARLAEAQLCERLGISRPSVREALRSLEAEKLILMLPNKGPQVARLSWAEAQAIYDVRTLLEGEAAARFVTHGAAENLAAMRRALTAFDTAVRRKDAPRPPVVHRRLLRRDPAGLRQSDHPGSPPGPQRAHLVPAGAVDVALQPPHS